MRIQHLRLAGRERERPDWYERVEDLHVWHLQEGRGGGMDDVVRKQQPCDENTGKGGNCLKMTIHPE